MRQAAPVASPNRWRGMLKKSEAPTLLWERIEIRLDENLDGLMRWKKLFIAWFFRCGRHPMMCRSSSKISGSSTSA
jgi:hypothetical protein